MSEEKKRAAFEECVKETECMLMVDEDTAFDIFRYAWQAALQESEAMEIRRAIVRAAAEIGRGL